MNAADDGPSFGPALILNRESQSMDEASLLARRTSSVEPQSMATHRQGCACDR
jgi:hypothetical protein